VVARKFLKKEVIMRYFKYQNLQKSNKKSKKAIVSAFSKEEKRQYRKAKFFSSLGNIIFFIVTIAVASMLIFLINLIREPEHIVLFIVYKIFKTILFIAAILFSFAVAAFTAIPFWDKYQPQTTIKRQMLTNAVAHLRQYYGVSEPILVTKCYEASDGNFTNHDICLFVAEGELSITANLLHGFMHVEKDLGCYSMKKEEITIRQIPMETTFATELIAGDVRFLLGSRAKKYIERNFL
jgi:hypothetical protein